MGTNPTVQLFGSRGRVSSPDEANRGYVPRWIANGVRFCMTNLGDLRRLMDSACVQIPGTFNALVGAAARDAGFGACYISGGASSVCAGVPDIGFLSLEYFCRLIREVALASQLPVIADADTGFGEEQMIRRTVIEYAQAGACALHIEDQVFPKRCGHLDGKELIALDHAVEKIRWAAEAAREVDTASGMEPGTGFLVCARTDAAGVEGLDEAVTRASAYADAGAQMIFPEGLRTEADFAEFAHRMRQLEGPDPRGGPYLLANMTEFGKTPMLSLGQFEQMGYSCVIYPVTMLRVAMGAVTRALDSLRQEGGVESLLGQMQTRDELYASVRYVPSEEWKYPI